MELKKELQANLELNSVQGTPEWHLARVGKITSSKISTIIGKGRGKEFTTTAETYMFELAAERKLKNEYKNESLDAFLDRYAFTNKAMEWGKTMEEKARTLYIESTGETVKEYGFINSGLWGGEEIDNYGDSPDGVILDKEGNRVGALEIKCPNGGTFAKYAYQLGSGESLKTVNADYYWQCQSHMNCIGVDWCDFIIYDEMLENGFKVYRIEKNEEDIALMVSRVKQANELIDAISESI